MERPPDFVACILVECNHACVLSADMQDDQALMNQGRGCDSPNRHVDPVLLSEVLMPKNLAAGGVEHVHAARGPERIRFTAIDCDRSSRPCRIANAAIRGF